MFKTIKTYRTDSMRMSGWDYSQNGKYFLTFVTEGRKHWFGKVVGGKMVLSEIGKIVQREWLKSFELRKELFLDEFIIMPNHLHAIVVLKNNTKELDLKALGNVDGLIRLSLKMEPKSISSFLAGFKSASTSRVDDFIDDVSMNIPKFNRYNRLWQRDYYDIIIRNNRQYQNIKKYIINNPLKWGRDKFVK